MRASDIEHALVTGATGFVGRPLCQYLQARGVRVRALARRERAGPWDEFVVHDVATEVPADVMAGVDTVFHLAGLAHVDGLLDDGASHAIHREGTARVLAAAETAGVARLVFVSTVKAGDTPLTSAYAQGKRAAEKLVLEAALRLHTVVVRPSLVYGPGWQGNLERMLEAVARGRFPPLPDVGNRRSLVHVNDLAVGLTLAAETPAARGHVYALTDGEPYSTRRIYEAMCSATGRRVPRWRVPAPVFRAARVVLPRVVERLLGDAWYDDSAARQDLGWNPTRTLEESLAEIVAHPGAAAPGP